MKIIFNILIICIFYAGYGHAYTPPIGIPNPSWGALHPIDTPSPVTATRCPNWPSAATTDCYYVDPGHGSATDLANNYGYPNKPRKTIPGNKTYIAGSYIYLAGQQNVLSQNIVFNCSENNPCWITSSDKTMDSTGGGGFSGLGRISIAGGTQYLFIENLLINNKTSTDNGAGVSLSNTANTVDSINHVVLRGNISKDIEYSGSTSVFGTNARDGGTSHDLVFYKNEFKNVGNPDDIVDLDLHSVGFGIRDVGTTTESYNIWFLENRCEDSTQCLQINGGVGGNAKLHHIYVGKNYGRNERQRSLSTKQASHVIFSQNEVIPGVNQAAGGYSEGMGWSLGADYIWFLFNNIHNGTDGIRNSDSTGGTSDTSHVFIIGNLIHDLSMNPYVPLNQQGYLGYAVNLEKGASTIHIVDNTFYNMLGGVKTMMPDTKLYLHGNLMDKIVDEYSFINFYSNQTPADLHINNNLFYAPDGNSRWNYTSSVYNDFAAWNAAHPEWNVDSYYGNPLIINETQNNYAVNVGSPAIGANTNENIEYGFPDVYALFESTYGISIRVDYNGNPRPASGLWSVGAFEGEYNSAVGITITTGGGIHITPGGGISLGASN